MNLLYLFSAGQVKKIAKRHQRVWPGLCVTPAVMQDKDKKTDHRPLEPELQVDEGPNKAAKRYPNPVAAQDLGKKTDTEQPRGAGGT